MIKIKFFSEFRIDKNPKIIENFINLYWQIFIEKNKKTKDLVFIKRIELVKNSKYNRRNCYKHLRHLLLKRIFIEEKNCLIPSSFIFKINKKIINPSEIVFNTKITRKIINKGIVNIKPIISSTKIRELSKLIFFENKRLYDFISLPFGIGEKISFSTSFSLSTFPKTVESIRLWNQKDKNVAKKEKELFRILNPNKDPFHHNCFMGLGREDTSPLLELEKDKKIYVIAGWAKKFSNLKRRVVILENHADKRGANAKLLFYDKNKNFLEEKKIVFPSHKDGIPLASISPLIFARRYFTKFTKNKNYLGYYEFKNSDPEMMRYSLNHIIVHFSKFKSPKKARFIKIYSGKSSLVVVVNIFPYDRLNSNFIKQRMASLNKRKFEQDKSSMLQYYNTRFINATKFKKIDKILKKASFEHGKKKQTLLLNALTELINYSYYLKKKISELTKKKKRIKNLIKFTHVLDTTITHINYCIKECPKSINKEVETFMKYNERFYQKIAPSLIKKIDFPESEIFFISKYATFFALIRKKGFLPLNKTLKEFLSDIKLIKGSVAKLTIIRTLLGTLKQKIEEDFFSKKTKKYLNYTLWLNEQRAKIYNELALKTIEFENKKEFNKEYIINKYKIYETLSLYYKYQNILYKTEYYEKTSKDKEKFKNLKLMLNQFKNKIF